MALYGTKTYGTAVYVGPPPPSTFYQEPTYGVYIGGIATSVHEAHTAHGVDEPVGTVTLVLSLPLPAHVVEGAVCEVIVDNGDRSARIFQGALRMHDRRFSDDGAEVTITADGWGYLLAFKGEDDVAFSGGAPLTPISIYSAPLHVGDETLAHYADDAPNGTTVTITGISSERSNFVTIAGRHHGSNSTKNDDELDMVTSSRIEIWQGGHSRGSAPLPVSDEKWVENEPDDEDPEPQIDFTLDAEWENFSVVVPVKVLAEGTCDVKFVSGTISDGQRDEFEVKQVTALMAVPINPHEVVRGLARQRGFMGGLGPSYAGELFVDVAGEEIFIGGNGYVDDGQIRIEKDESWLDRCTELSTLFGYRSFDCPDGKFRTRKYRGLPDKKPSTDFTEGVDAFDIGYVRDTRPILTYIEVTGASGTDSFGQPFAYRSVADVIPAHPLIPNPPGVAFTQISSEYLVSNDLCEQVREIAEIDFGDVYQEYSWSSYCHPWVHPGMVATLTFPTMGIIDTDVWIKSVSTDISDDGIWSTYTGWIGSGIPLPGDDDCIRVPLRLGGGTVSRLYLTGDAPTWHPTVLRGSWNDGGGGEEGSLEISPTPDLHRSTVSETSSDPNWDVLLFRGTSAPLTKSQTIQGWIRFGANVSGLAESANMRGRYHCYVTEGDTNVVRGTLLDAHEELIDWPISGKGVETARLAITPVAALAGDRIVLESGYRARNTVTSARWGRLHYGGRDLGDAKHLSGEKGSAWVEFSDLLAPGGYRHGRIVHVGDTAIPSYADPSPDGTVHSATFQLGEDFTSIAVHGLIHGSNSFLLQNQHADSVPSKVECWQAGTLIGEAQLPLLAEGGTSRDYDDDDRWWTAFQLPITGSFEAGQVEVRFVAGTDASKDPPSVDEFEIKTVSMEICGMRLPSLPDVPTIPIIPPRTPIPFGVTLLAYAPSAVVLDADTSDATYPSQFQIGGNLTIPAGTRFIRASALVSGLMIGTEDTPQLYIESYARPQMGVEWVERDSSTTRPWFETGMSRPRLGSGTRSVELTWEYSTDVDVPNQHFKVVTNTPAQSSSSTYTLGNMKIEAFGTLATPPYVHVPISPVADSPLYSNRWTWYGGGDPTTVRFANNDLWFLDDASARDTSRKIIDYTKSWQLQGRIRIYDTATRLQVGLGSTPSSMQYLMELDGATGSFRMRVPNTTGSGGGVFTAWIPLTTPAWSSANLYEWFINFKASTGLVTAKIGRNTIAANGSDAVAGPLPRGKPVGSLYTCFNCFKTGADGLESGVLYSTVGPVIDVTLDAATFLP
jgi:hypothetical protein